MGKENLHKSIHLIDAVRFEKEINSKCVQLFDLINKNGLVVQITNYGARIVSFWAPDDKGDFEDIVLGYDHIDKYLESSKKYYGATIGRYANRISHGQFSIGSTNYQLATNNGPNHLHGGPHGFHQAIWEVVEYNKRSVKLSYLSLDGEENFPGDLTINILFTLNDDNQLVIQYEAQTNEKTIINLTNHAYFNLKGAGNGTIRDHFLQIDAAQFIPTDEYSIPLSSIRSVAGVMDFRTAKLIDKDIDHASLKIFGGYDHTWVLHNQGKIKFAAEVYDPKSKRLLKVYTNQPGVQFYSNNTSKVDALGKYGKTYINQEAFCLETQHFPDSPNRPDFPSTLLAAGETYQATCIYQCSIKK